MVDIGKISSFLLIPVSAVMLDDESVVTILAPQVTLDHKEIAAAVLGIKPDISTEMISELLIRRGYLLSEAQCMEMERKMGTKVLPDGGSTIFFQKTVHSSESVMTGFGGFWSGYVCLLGDEIRCGISDRVLIRNLNLSGTEPDDDTGEDRAVSVSNGPGVMVLRPMKW